LVDLRPTEQERYTPEYPVAESQRVPFGSAETADPPAPVEQPQTEETVEADATDAGAGETEDEQPVEGTDGSEEAPPEDESGGETAVEPDDSVDPTESTASERKTIDQTRERMEAQGVRDYAELDEELYIRVSAKMVIMASVLSKSADADADPARIQALLADNAAEVLAKHRVDPEDFWSYTRDVHSDPERAKEMGEKIMREAEKHTRHEITVEEVPGMSPTPVPGAAVE
jgi:hypothetical protein